MGTSVPSDEILELSRAFHDLSVELTNYRYDNFARLSSDNRHELDSRAWTLLNTASDLCSQYISSRLAGVDTASIEASIKALQVAKGNIEKIKQVLEIAAAAIALAGAIYSATGIASAGAIVDAIKALNDASASKGNQVP